ncbi:hypothetical protein ACFYSF_16555 [Streptomyces canus]|uniref:hypothetical protein n=1 Tax=Streptomyces canus TaxID=58343 RepID=UPI00369A3B0A
MDIASELRSLTGSLSRGDGVFGLVVDEAGGSGRRVERDDHDAAAVGPDVEDLAYELVNDLDAGRPSVALAFDGYRNLQSLRPTQAASDMLVMKDLASRTNAFRSRERDSS